MLVCGKGRGRIQLLRQELSYQLWRRVGSSTTARAERPSAPPLGLECTVYPGEGELFTYPAGLSPSARLLANTLHLGTNYQRMTYPAPSPHSSPARFILAPQVPSLARFLAATRNPSQALPNCSQVLSPHKKPDIHAFCLELVVPSHLPHTHTSHSLLPSDKPHTTTRLLNIFIMSATTVNVKNIAGSTDDKEIRDFFSFW